jgi:hypothetical protein
LIQYEQPLINFKTEREREREREEKVGRGIVRETTHKRCKKKYFSPVLKVPRQCWLVLLAVVRLKGGNDLESLNIKCWDVGFIRS